MGFANLLNAGENIKVKMPNRRQPLNNFGQLETGFSPRTAVLMLSVYVLAGVASGGLEFWVANAHGLQADLGNQILQLLVACTCFAVCGLVVGAGLVLLAWFTRRGLNIKLVAALLVIATFYIGLSYSLYFSIVIYALTALVGFSSFKLKSPSMIPVLLIWLGFIHVLRPLFSGKSMELVFSGPQTFLIFCLIAPALYLALDLLTHRTFSGRFLRSKPILTFQALAALAAAVWVAHLSGVFLIRLWGFHTMEFMQGLFIIIQILLLGFLISRVGRCFINQPRKHLAVSGVFCCLALLPMIYATNLAMNIPVVSAFVLKRLPNSGLILSSAALRFDKDKDGYGAMFGFGDCNDRDRRIHPGAIDLPLDGVDANCFNGDLKSIVHGYFNQPVDISVPDKTATIRPKAAIFVVVDTLRADAVNYSLENNSTTPTLAKIASQSVQFNTAYAQSNNTLESFPFMFHVGFRNLSRYNTPWTLVSNLHQAQIPSAAVLQLSTQEWWAEGMHQVLLGFDKTYRPDPSARIWSNEDNADKAIGELQANSGQDSFLFVHFESLHDYATQAMEGGRMIQQGLNLSELTRLLNSADLAEAMRSRYMSALSKADPALARLWDAIKELEKTTDVLLVVAADHGEEFLEHGGFFHMGTLYQELVRVPLLVYETGVSHRVVDTPVGLYRIAPTLLRFLGFKGNFVSDLDLLRTPLKEFEIFGNFSISEQSEQQYYMVVRNNFKLIYDLAHNQIEIYNLTEDPGEKNNLFADARYANVQQQLMDEMDITLFYMSYGDLELLKAKAELESKNRSTDLPVAATP